MSSRKGADPFYRALLAEIADTEWQALVRNLRAHLTRC